MQSAEWQNVLDVINFNWNQRTFHAALKDEKQIYNEDKAGMVIWKGLGRKINVALISPSKAVWGGGGVVGRRKDNWTHRNSF